YVQPPQHFHEVEVRLAGGDDADRGVRAPGDLAVDAVDPGERAHRIELGMQALFDLQRRQVRPAVVQSVGRGRVAGRRDDTLPVLPRVDPRVDLVQVDGRSAFDHFRQRGEA